MGEIFDVLEVWSRGKPILLRKAAYFAASLGYSINDVISEAAKGMEMQAAIPQSLSNPENYSVRLSLIERRYDQEMEKAKQRRKNLWSLS